MSGIGELSFNMPWEVILWGFHSTPGWGWCCVGKAGCRSKA